jgi:hypothetical protein
MMAPAAALAAALLAAAAPKEKHARLSLIALIARKEQRGFIKSLVFS